MISNRRTMTALGSALLLLTASGCSMLESDKIDYKSASRAKVSTLEVPPDLTQLPAQSRYQMPGGAVTATGYQAGQAAAGAVRQNTSDVASNAIGDVHYQRQGDQRWLHVDRPADDKLWGSVRDFWLENGFLLTTDEPKTGIMETDWAENRAKIPDDLIRRTIGKVFDALYSTGLRDRFIIRMERSGQGGTDIFISHRGMEEVYANSQHDSTVWQPRPSDHDLEAEFLRRLMVKLGVSEEQSKAMIASGSGNANNGSNGGGNVQTTAVPNAAAVIMPDGTAAVQITDEFERAWRRVGVALDRTGFTVEDRDRSKGIYFVRYVDPSAEKKEPGFFSKLFGGASKPLPTTKYQVVVRADGQHSLVNVLTDTGAPAPAADAQRIVKVLADELR